MVTLKNDKVPFANEINFSFNDIYFTGEFKGAPNSVGLLIEINNLNIYNAVMAFLDHSAFSSFKGDNKLIFNNLNIIPNTKTRTVDFLSVSESLPSELTRGFEVFKSSDVDALIIYSIITADRNFSISNFRELIRKLQMSNSNFTVDSIEKFLSMLD